MNDGHAPSATFEDYCSAVRRLSEAIDRVLENGRNVQRRVEAFADVHGLDLHSDQFTLLADGVHPDQRRIHAALLNLNRRLYDELLTGNSIQASVTTGARLKAIGNKTRI